MATDLINSRGQIVGTRMTVYQLLIDFLDPTKTENYVCKLYDLTADQVAAARAFIFNNLDTVLTQHLEIEKRIAAGNPPEVIEQAKKTHAALINFKQWLLERQKADAIEGAAAATSESGNGQFPTFREWFAQQESRPTQGS